MTYVMVLDDGETWSNLDGCEIRVIPDDWEDSELPPLLYKDRVAKFQITHRFPAGFSGMGPYPHMQVIEPAVNPVYVDDERVT